MAGMPPGIMLDKGQRMSNMDVIKSLYETFKDKNWDRFGELSDPNLEWIQNEGFPKGKHSRGYKQVVENVFEVFARDWETWSFEICEYLDAGDNIIVLGAYKGTHKVTAKEFSAAAAHVFDLKDGRVRRFRQYTDTAQIWKAIT